MNERQLIWELANEVAGLTLALMQEGGVATSSKGEPLNNEDSALGRACAYLGQPIPVCPGWDTLEEIAPLPPGDDTNYKKLYHLERDP